MPTVENIWRRAVWGLITAVVITLGGALLRTWLVPAQRGDLAPEAYNWRLRLPWSPREQVTLAFPTPDGNLWVSVRRSVPKATPLVVLRELAAGPPPGSGLVPALPAGAVVAGVTVNDAVATIHMSGWEPAPEDPAVAETLTTMARTLAGQFPLTGLRAATASGRSLGSVPVPDTPSGHVTYLWQGRPVPVAASLPDGPDRPAEAVRRLLAGPAPVGVEGKPEGISLLSVQVRGDLARVALDLSPANTQALTAGRWLFAPHAMAMVYTLTDLPGIRRVQFDFPSLPPAARRQCRTPLGVPLVRPEPEAALAKGEPL